MPDFKIGICHGIYAWELYWDNIGNLPQFSTSFSNIIIISGYSFIIIFGIFIWFLELQ